MLKILALIAAFECLCRWATPTDRVEAIMALATGTPPDPSVAQIPDTS